MYYLTLLLLLLAVLLQSAAALVALLQLRSALGHRLAWGGISLALFLMVPRRVAPLELAVSTGLFEFTSSLLAFLISLLMLLGLIGLRHLFQELAGQREELRQLATTDALTGLANRREFFARAGQEILRAQRNGGALALLMLDLDHFKRVNDQYGHAVGDQVLQALAGALQSRVRRIDLLARIGGEEFVLLMPESDREAALAAGERLRLAAAELCVGETGVRIHLSVGVSFAAHIPADSPLDDFLQALLQEADTALYVAKQRGRNRVEVWTPEMGHSPS